MQLRSAYKHAFIITAAMLVTPVAYGHGYAPSIDELLRRVIPKSCDKYFYSEVPNLKRLRIAPTTDGRGIAVDMYILGGNEYLHRVMYYRQHMFDNGFIKLNGVYVNGFEQNGTGKNNGGINLTISGGAFYATDDNPATILSYQDKGNNRFFSIESLPGSPTERMAEAEQQRLHYRKLALACGL